MFNGFIGVRCTSHSNGRTHRIHSHIYNIKIKYSLIRSTSSTHSPSHSHAHTIFSAFGHYYQKWVKNYDAFATKWDEIEKKVQKQKREPIYRNTAQILKWISCNAASLQIWCTIAQVGLCQIERRSTRHLFKYVRKKNERRLLSMAKIKTNMHIACDTIYKYYGPTEMITIISNRFSQ